MDIGVSPSIVTQAQLLCTYIFSLVDMVCMLALRRAAISTIAKLEQGSEDVENINARVCIHASSDVNHGSAGSAANGDKYAAYLGGYFDAQCSAASSSGKSGPR